MTKPIVILMLVFTATFAFSSDAKLPKGTSKVVAYLYDYTANPTKWITMAKGDLHSGVVSKYTKTLSEDDTVLLLNALSEKHQPRARPFSEPAPHHAIVFYDKEEKIIARISICFQSKALFSSQFKHIKDPLSSFWDWNALQNLFTKNGLPILDNDAEYTKLRTQSAAQKAKTNKANKSQQSNR